MQTYDQSGNYIALAGMVVVLLSKLNIIVTQNDVLAIAAGCISAYGVFKQWKSHKNLAITAGAISASSK